MKKIFCFLAVAATAAFTSCSSDDDSGNNGENPGNEVTAINLTASATSVEVGTAVTFTVTDQNNAAVADAVLTANGTAITSAWTAETAGEYTVVATLGELTDTLTVTVTEAGPVASDSFVMDGTNYETPNFLIGLSNSIFYYNETPDEYFSTWNFTALQQVGEGEEATFPNVVDIVFNIAVTPDSYDENNQPVFGAIQFPEVGEYTLTGGDITYFTVIYNGNDLADGISSADDITEVSLNITAISITQAEGETSTVAYTYTITLANGTVINGEFSGEISGSYNNNTGSKGVNRFNIPFVKGTPTLRKL